MKYGYVRVSTTEQKIGRQLVTMQKHNVDIGGLDPLTADSKIFNSIRSGNTFIDKLSGKDTNRPQFQDLLNTVQAGDTIVFSELSRMGRNLKDIVTVSDELINRGVNLIFEKEQIDPSTTMGRAMMAMFGVIAQLERDLILEMTHEGIKIAQAKGKYKGRKPLELDNDTLDLIFKKYVDGGLTAKKAASMIAYTMASGEKKVGVSIPTFYRYLDEWCSKNNYKKLGYIQNINTNNTNWMSAETYNKGDIVNINGEQRVVENTLSTYEDEDVPSDIFSDMNIE